MTMQAIAATMPALDIATVVARHLARRDLVIVIAMLLDDIPHPHLLARAIKRGTCSTRMQLSRASLTRMAIASTAAVSSTVTTTERAAAGQGGRA